MSSAFDMTEVVELSGDVSEAIEAYLDDADDEVLDFQIHYNDRGEHCVAVAFQFGDLVKGGILLAMPHPASGENMYKMSGIYEDSGPRVLYELLALQNEMLERSFARDVSRRACGDD